MVTCICKNVTDTQILCSISDGDNSLDLLRNKLGVTEKCGKCTSTIENLLKAAALALVVQGCAITPSVYVDSRCAIDYRHNGHNHIKQTFFTTMPAYGSYALLSLNYKF